MTDMPKLLIKVGIFFIVVGLAWKFIPLFVGSKTLTSRLRENRCPALAARISGRFAPSDEAKSASLSGTPTSCVSERAASAFLKKIGGGITVRKSPIGSTNHQWGMKKSPLMEVSLYR
ncbi:MULTISPECIES: hypothetical protein [unclassified Bacillus (in: firmicutes)]|uniref:hypothetical protein n=1 Tax=unclassified Bacillus (in: firmicutes) TaxID=185979 RepID=UPI000B8148C6|nr:MULTISPECIES: hypothetical protein [unclassified Bacillus (in: firmicutes)]